MLTGQGIALVTPNSDQLCTVVLAIINLILVLIPSKATCFETTSESAVLGKMYSQHGFIKHAMPYTESNKLVMTYIHYFTSRCFGGARRQRSDPLEHPFEMVRFTLLYMQRMLCTFEQTRISSTSNI